MHHYVFVLVCQFSEKICMHFLYYQMLSFSGSRKHTIQILCFRRRRLWRLRGRLAGSTDSHLAMWAAERHATAAKQQVPPTETVHLGVLSSSLSKKSCYSSAGMALDASESHWMQQTAVQLQGCRPMQSTMFLASRRWPGDRNGNRRSGQ